MSPVTRKLTERNGQLDYIAASFPDRLAWVNQTWQVHMNKKSWWRHDMETLSPLLTFSVVNPSVTSGFPSRKVWICGDSTFLLLMLVRASCWTNSQFPDNLRHWWDVTLIVTYLIGPRTKITYYKFSKRHFPDIFNIISYYDLSRFLKEDQIENKKALIQLMDCRRTGCRSLWDTIMRFYGCIRHQISLVKHKHHFFSCLPDAFEYVRLSFRWVSAIKT